MIDRALKEADAIWRSAGVALLVGDDATRPGASSSIEVEFVDDTGGAAAREIPLAWIEFFGNTPTNHIRVSVRNGFTLARNAPNLPGGFIYIPAAVDEVMGRALGRALAHEIGHYLLHSRAHSRGGLMAARFSPQELFGLGRLRFLPTAAERGALAAALRERDLMLPSAS